MNDLLEALDAPACQPAAPSKSTKQCEYCRRDFPKPKWEAYSDWETRRFCSRPCANVGKALKIDVEALRALYVVEQRSLPAIAVQFGISSHTVRCRLLQAGVEMRTHAHAISLVRDKLGSGMRGKKRVFSQEWKDRIRAGKIAHGEKHAKGVSHKKNGYVQITRGENKNRSQHVVLVEKRIGRHLLPTETVHHDDEDRSNNSDKNLILMTRSEHMRLHRERDALAGRQRKRDENGRFR